MHSTHIIVNGKERIESKIRLIDNNVFFEIKIGEKYPSISDEYFFASTQLCLNISISQLMDLFSSICTEMKKFD